MLGIPQSELYKYRCDYVVGTCGKLVLQQAIRWLNDGSGESLKTKLLKMEGYSETKFKREFNGDQRAKIEVDAYEDFDVTLCYKLLQRVCGLADINDNCWVKAGDKGPSLEYKIQRVKKLRNTLAHDEKTFTEAETRLLVSDLNQALVDIIAEVGQRSSVPQNEVSDKIAEVKLMIKTVCDKIREPLDRTDINHFHQLQQEARDFKVQLKDEFLKATNEELSSLFRKLCKIEPAPWALHQKYEANPTQVFVRVKVKEDKDLSSNRGVNQTPEIPCDDILEIQTHSGKVPDVIVLSGEGGKGKTSLTKYFLDEYLKGNSCSVKKLCNIEMLLHVEPRNDQISNLKELMKNSFPQAYAHLSLSYEHLHDILMDVQKLIIIDGFDEHNSTSRKLVKELLNLPGKNKYLITTRPNSVEDVNMLVPTAKSKLNLLLQGIPNDQHEKFVVKLLGSLLVSQDKILRTKRDLMSCLNRLKQTLGEQLNTPLTLALIVLLYVVSPDTVGNLSSSSDLYEELRSMMTDKLVHRIVTSSNTSEQAAKKRCKKFLQQFDQISFRTFCRKEYELRSNTTEKLVEACEDLDLQEELVLSSYLNTKRSVRGISTVRIYTYQHIMMQEFAAGKYLARKVIKYLEDCEFPLESLSAKTVSINGDVIDNGELNQDDTIDKKGKTDGKMRHFSGLSSEKLPKCTQTIFQTRRKKMSECSNIIWRVLRHEFPYLAQCDSDSGKNEFISRAQNVLMFMIGAIRAEYEEKLVSLAYDIVQLVDDEKTTTNQPYMDILMRLVAESGNNNEITKVVATEVEQLTREKFCIVKDSSLSVFQNILKFTSPKKIAVDIYSEPHLVEELVPTLNTLASRHTKLSLVFRHSYHDGNDGDCSEFLAVVGGGSAATCELTEFWWSLNDAGLLLLPQCLDVLCLRLSPEQIPELNKCVASLNIWSLATVVNLNHRPAPWSVPSLAFEGQRVVPVVAANIGDDEADITWAVDVLGRLCPPHRNRHVELIGFWETKVTCVGAEMLLRAVAEAGFAVTEFVAVRTTELMTQRELDHLSATAVQLGLVKVLMIKDP